MQQDPIQVPMPLAWRIIGSLFIAGVLIAFGGSVHFLAAGKTRGGFDTFIFVLHSALTPLLVSLLMPCDLQRYPAWVVRIYGRHWLQKLIAECRIHIGAAREGKALAGSPSSWIRDQRWLWLLIIGVCIVLGAINAGR